MNKKTTHRKKPKLPFFFILKLILLVSIVLLILFGGLRLFTDFFGQPMFTQFLVQQEKTLDASGLLIQMRGGDELKLLEYVHKTVFPFDYIDRETNLEALSRSIQNDRSGRAIEEILTPREWVNFEAFNLARATGFDPNAPGNPFLVITLVYEFGYKLGKVNPPVFTMVEDQSQLLIESPQLLRIRIEDPRRSSYPYPDVRISPENWRRISDFVVSQAENNPDLPRARENAEVQARQFFVSLLAALEQGETTVSITR